MRTVSYEEAIQLIDETTQLVNTNPSDINEHVYQNWINLRRKLGEYASNIKYSLELLDIDIEKIESQWILDLKRDKNPDTVVRASKWLMWLDEKARRVQLSYVHSRIITEISVLWHWIDISKAELIRQSKIT